MLRYCLLAALMSGCHLLYGNGPGADAANGSDARNEDGGSLDSSRAQWSTPEELTAFSTSNFEQEISVSADETRVTLRKFSPSGASGILYAWDGTSAALLQQLTNFDQVRFSPDGEYIFGSRQFDIYEAKKNSNGYDLSNPQAIVEVSTAEHEKWYSPCADGRALFIRVDAIFEHVPGQPPMRVEKLNLHGKQTAVFLSSDCKHTVFTAFIAETNTWRLFEGDRDNAGNWQLPTIIPDVNMTGSNDVDPCLSGDGQTLYFASDRSGQYHIYRSMRVR